MNQHTPEVIQEALTYIPSDERETWVAMACAVKSELGESGFDLWNEWSQSSDSYQERDAKSVWKSIKEGGRITVGSLFYEAKQRGFKLNGHGGQIDPTESERIRKEREERQRIEAERREKEEAAAALRAEEILGSSSSASQHPYLARKGVRSVPGLRVGKWHQVGEDGSRFREKAGCLLVQMRDEDGKLWNLQAIFPEKDTDLERDKDYLLGGRKQGTYFPIGKPQGVVVLVEGLATGLSIREATGHAVCVAFDKGNLAPVGRALRSKFPDARLIFAADNDLKEGKPNYGVEKANEAAADVGGFVAVPELAGRKADFNDLHQERGADAVKAAIEGARPAVPKEQQEGNAMQTNVVHIVGTGWPEPRPLQRKLSDSTPFPVDALGDVLGPAANVTTSIIQAPLAISGNSMLAGAHLAAQGHANVVIDGRRHPISEFFVTIGKTGERKSAVDNVALRPHRDRQDELRAIHAREHAEHERNADAYKKAKEEAISSAKSKTYEAKVKALTELGEAPQDPLEPFLICEEPTYEGLVKMLAHGQPSIGLFSDEGGRFIGGHGMNNDNLLKTAAGMSGLWDGRAISRVRAGDGAALLPGRRVSCHLMAQPDIAQLMLSNSVLIEQGLLSRCLVTWPESTAGRRFYKEMDLTGMPEINDYSVAMMKLLTAGMAMTEGARNELAPRDLILEPNAKSLWIAFHDQIEEQLIDGGELAQIRGLANKAPEHAARIAATLALVDDLACAAVSARWMNSGIALVTHYLNEAMRLYEAGIADPEIREAEKLLGWLDTRPDNKRTLVSLVEIYQFGPNSIRNAKTARGLMKLLEDHGYVKPASDPEGKRRECWSVRP